MTPTAALVGCKKSDGTPIEREQLAEEIGQVVCQVYSDCACESEAIASGQECQTALKPSLERAIVEGELYGLRYYGECLDKAETLLRAFGCGLEFDPEDVTLAEAIFDAQVCKLLAGDAGRGDPCTSIGDIGFSSLGDTCAHDLVCAGGICVKWPEGEGDICHDIGVCPPGLACIDPDADGVLTCQTPAQSGQPCNPHDLAGCTTDLYCSATSQTCEPLPGAGQACLLGQCASGLVCDGEVCLDLPGQGEPCILGGICDAGLECDFTTMTCAPLPPLPGEGEACLNGFLCAEGLFCNDLAICEEPPPFVCSVPESLGLCIYRGDGICDEPEGTGLCLDGTDPEDCSCPSENDYVCDEPEGTGFCPDGTDSADCACPTAGNGICNEPAPAGDGTCEAGTDPLDCGGLTCPADYETNGVCDEPACPIGTDPDCVDPACPYQGDGQCDEPEGTGLCPEGTDPIDCGAAECPSQGDGICDEPEGTGLCPEGTDPLDCAAGVCPSQGDGICDEPEGTGLCPEGTDPLDCAAGVCPIELQGDGFCDEPEPCPIGTDPDCAAEDCPPRWQGDGECDEPEGTNLCPEGTDPLDCP